MTRRLRVSFVESDEPVLQVCWHNITLADQYHQLELFALSCSAWTRLTGLSYQALECQLRERGLQSVLIAAQPIEGVRLAMWNQARELRYRCIFSCRPHDKALDEMLCYADSYEQNLERLGHTGDICVSKSLIMPPENTLAHMILQARHKLCITLV